VTADALVAVGEVLRPWGLGGEVRVRPLTDRPEERFRALRDCVLWDPRPDRREPCRITSCRFEAQTVLVRVEGVTSPEAAQRLTGRLLAVAQDAGFFESFRIADDILRQGVQGITDIITIPGIINRDFADVKAIMAGMGYAVMGTATAAGPRRSTEAANKAIASPLLETGAIDGARGILINVTGSSSLKLAEVNEASMIIQAAAHEDANIIFGAVLDDKMQDSIKITVIATGFRDIPRFQREAVLSRNAPIMVRDTPRYSEPEPEPVFEPEPPMIMAEPESHLQAQPQFQPQVLTMETVQATTYEAPPSYEQYDQHDLDVPAFIRKRAEIM